MIYLEIRLYFHVVLSLDLMMINIKPRFFSWSHTANFSANHYCLWHFTFLRLHTLQKMQEGRLALQMNLVHRCHCFLQEPVVYRLKTCISGDTHLLASYFLFRIQILFWLLGVEVYLPLFLSVHLDIFLASLKCTFPWNHVSRTVKETPLLLRHVRAAVRCIVLFRYISARICSCCDS